MNKGKIFEPLNFLEFTGLLQSKSFFIFLLNSMKSSWALVRINAFELLSRFSDSFSLFNDSNFVNKVLLVSAFEFANDAKAMISEAAGLLLKLVFLKCIPALDLEFLSTIVVINKPLPENKQLALCYHVLYLV